MVTLQTDRLVLRPIVSADAAWLHATSCLPSVREQLLPGQATEAAAEQVAAASEFHSGRFCAFMILLQQGDGKPVGSCTLAMTNPLLGHASVGWEVHPDHWGHGYATEAAGALIRLGFGPCRVRRIRAECYRDNVGSRRVMEKVGLIEKRSVVARLSLWWTYPDTRPKVRYELWNETWRMVRSLRAPRPGGGSVGESDL